MVVIVTRRLNVRVVFVFSEIEYVLAKRLDCPLSIPAPQIAFGRVADCVCAATCSAGIKLYTV